MKLAEEITEMLKKKPIARKRKVRSASSSAWSWLDKIPPLRPNPNLYRGPIR